VLGLLYGTVDVTDLDAFVRVVVLPKLPPSTSSLSGSGTRAKLLINQSAHPINVKNWTLFTNIMGPDYELEFFHPGADTVEATAEAAVSRFIAWVWLYVALVFYATVVLHQDTLYYYTSGAAASTEQ
jgi:hypothetical protein